jgi:hypothetical protein
MTLLPPAERPARLAVTAALLVWGLWIMRTPDGYHLVDDLDLAIHEAGHLLFGFGGDRLAALGGTLLQLLVPATFGAYFARRRDWHAVTVMVWWLGQNGWNIARYVADAREQALPLVGGGEHDWAFLLGEWGLLHRDAALAGGIRVAAFGLMLGSCVAGWAALRRPPAARPAGAPA